VLPEAGRLMRTVLRDLLPQHSAWRTGGSDRIAPCLTLSQGLPAVRCFVALMHGDWARWGWHVEDNPPPASPATPVTRRSEFIRDPLDESPPPSSTPAPLARRSEFIRDQFIRDPLDESPPPSSMAGPPDRAQGSPPLIDTLEAGTPPVEPHGADGPAGRSLEGTAFAQGNVGSEPAGGAVPGVARRAGCRWASAYRTDPGRVRDHNEDACLALPERGLWVVADGMGGHADGAVASAEVIRGLEQLPDEADIERLGALAEAGLLQVNTDLRIRAVTHPWADVIGSTVVVLLARDRHAVCLWAGDSRAYLYRDRELVQITRDHSVVEQLVFDGAISREEALAHPQANALTRAVGGEDELRLDEVCVDVRPGDLFLLCTDGLTKEVPEAEVAQLLGTAEDLQRTADALVERALAHGGRDNVTVALVRAEG
jgi:protein phosphatase